MRYIFQHQELKIARIRAGLEQRELAKLLSIKANCLSSWERGERKPRIDKLLILCKEVNLDPRKLFEKATTKPKKRGRPFLADEWGWLPNGKIDLNYLALHKIPYEDALRHQPKEK